MFFNSQLSFFLRASLNSFCRSISILETFETEKVSIFCKLLLAIIPRVFIGVVRIAVSFKTHAAEWLLDQPQLLSNIIADTLLSSVANKHSSSSSFGWLWRSLLWPFTVLQKNVLQHKYPCESHQEHCSPHNFLLKLCFSLLYCEKFFVWVTLLLFLIEFILFVHASHFSFVPDSLIIINLQLWTSGHKPPKIVNPKQSLSAIIEILLFAILLFFLVYKTLVVIDGVDSLLQQLEAKVGEKTPFHECDDRAYECIGIPWVSHYLPCVVSIE